MNQPAHLIEQVIDEALVDLIQTPSGGAAVARLKQSAREVFEEIEAANIDLSGAFMEILPRLIKLSAGFQV